MDMAELDEVGIGGGGDCKDEMIGKLPSKNWNGATGYLTLNASKLLPNWDKRSAKLWYCNILIQNIISGLKLMCQATVLVEF